VNVFIDITDPPQQCRCPNFGCSHGVYHGACDESAEESNGLCRYCAERRYVWLGELAEKIVLGVFIEEVPDV
jgi:hypothetical protein